MLRYAFVLLSLLMACTAPTGLRTARESVALVALVRDGILVGRASAVAIQCDKNTGDAGYTIYYVTAKHVLERVVTGELRAYVGYQMEFDVRKFDEVKNIHLHPSADASLFGVQSNIARTVSKLSATVVPDQEIVSIGYPSGYGPYTEHGTVNLRIANRADGAWVCTAPTAPGGSGGAVLDKDTLSLIGITIEVGGGQTPDGHTYILPGVHIFIAIESIIDWITENISHG